MISLANHLGNPYIGVYCSASNRHAFISGSADDALATVLQDSLSVEVVRLSISGATIVGSLLASNSRGVVVSNLATEKELSVIPDDLEIAIMEIRFNAAGNNILVNDRAALVHPEVSNETLSVLRDILDVEIVRGTLAGISTVGSVALVTGKGVLCHPRATEEDIEMLKDLFSLPVTLATLNYGTPWLGACAVANDNGSVVGEKTTPIEMGKLEDGLGFI